MAVEDTVQIAARVPSDLAEQLNEIAKRNERTASAELRRALVSHVESEQALKEADAA